jgi:M6 family metalloprotease-like protein
VKRIVVNLTDESAIEWIFDLGVELMNYRSTILVMRKKNMMSHKMNGYIVLLLSLLSVFHFPAAAAPYFNTPYTFMQPDGSSVTVILNGDEFYMQAETPDGYTVIRDPQTGWICYAELSGDGSELISTGVPIENGLKIAGQSNVKEKKISANKTIQKQFKIKTDSKLKKIKQKQQQLFGKDVQIVNGLAYSNDAAASAVSGESLVQGYSTLQPAPGTLPSTKNISTFSGTIKGLVLIFDFSDAPASYTMQQYRDKVNKVNSHHANGNAASLRTYYEDVSRGVFLMDHFVYGIYRAPQTFAYYDSLNMGEGAQQLMSYGLNDMEANGFDFSQLTTFSSGEIRALTVMYTGNPPTWAQGMWYHAGGWGGFSADGVHTGRYCTDTANDLNPGTLIHEHGHMAAEWPDTYSYIGGEPGTWCIMGGGYTDLPNPYFLYENGWLDAENIMDLPGLKTMNSSDPFFAYFYYDPAQPTEFYMIRPYVTSLLYCPSIPDQGMTFWRINTQGDNAQYPNTDRHIELVHANNVDTNKTTNVCFKEGGLLDQFTPYTTPSTNWKFGVKASQQSGMDITDISTAGASMTFVLGTPPQPVPYYPLNGSFNDSSASAYHAAGYNFSGSPWSADSFKDAYFDLNQSLRFDGVNDYVVCPAAASAGVNLTIAFWIKPEMPGAMTPLDKFPADSSGAGWSVQLTQDGRVLFLIGSQSNYTQVTTIGPVYEANRWAHVACTYSGGTAKIYVNGALRIVKKGITQSTNTTALNVQMGIASQVNTNRIYQGWIDDVRFYNVCMESGQLNAIDGLNRKPDKGILAFLKLDETSGSRAEDSSGHDYYGTLNNGLSFDTDSISGAVGKALSFDGVDDYISLPAGMQKRNGGFTVALWAYPTAVKEWARFIDFGSGPYSGNVLLARYQSSNDLAFEVYSMSGSGGVVRATGAIELNKWQFFTACVDTSGNVKIYKNGQVVKTGTSAVMPEIYRRNLYIGRSNWSADSYYEGGMDDIRIYNYTLTDAEILAIYQNNRMDGPVPFGGAEDVSPEITLRFTPAANALRHDIYFGTQYNAVQAANPQSAEYIGRKQLTEYNPPALEAFREYFWRVDEVLINGTVQTGSVWRFSTTGSIQRQVWTGLSSVDAITGLTGSANYPNNPTLVTTLNTFEIPTDWADNYGTRVRGLLVPQTSGSYRFWISGDNEVELWLGTTANPANVSLIAYLHGAISNPQSFDQHASQRSALITLQAGQPYYIMALHKEGYGGDHMAVAWQGPDSPTRQIIDAFWLRPPRDNEWPRFNPATIPTQNATEGIAFSASLSAAASDSDSDTISYSKQVGPDWLVISSAGQLSGVPKNRDAGLNTFTVRASDGKGGYDDTTLPIQVADRFTGSMGLSDLVGFTQEWLSGDTDSPANLDQVGLVNLEDFAWFSKQWNEDLIDGLVAHWTLDDTAGLVARDSYAHHHGVLTNMTEYNWMPGVSNNGLAFDGTDDYVKITGYKGITGTASRTCSAWIKTSGSTANTVIMDWGTASADQKWLFGIFATGELAVYTWPSYIKTNLIVTDNQWHHVAAVLVDDGTPNVNEIKLYVDGLLQATTVSSAQAINTAAAADVLLGACDYAGAKGFYFKGLIDDVQIYNRGLSQNEILEMASTKMGLAAEWKLDESAGTTAKDALGLHDGTLRNTTGVWVAGKTGNALTFDGTNDYVEITGYKGVAGTASRTCSAWIKTSGSTSNMVIMDWGTAVSGQKWLFGIFATGQLALYTWTPYIQTNITVTDNQWHHVAAVLTNDGTPDVSEIKLYVDGLLQATTVSSSQAINTIWAANVLLGACDNAGAKGFYFNGLMDEVRIYNRQLTETEIASLAQ